MTKPYLWLGLQGLREFQGFRMYDRGLNGLNRVMGYLWI